MIRRSEALADGSADHELRAMYERGGWERFVNGVYVPSSRLAGLTEQERHRLLIDAILPILSVVTSSVTVRLHYCTDYPYPLADWTRFTSPDTAAAAVVLIRL